MRGLVGEQGVAEVSRFRMPGAAQDHDRRQRTAEGDGPQPRLVRPALQDAQASGPGGIRGRGLRAQIQEAREA